MHASVAGNLVTEFTAVNFKGIVKTNVSAQDRVSKSFVRWHVPCFGDVVQWRCCRSCVAGSRDGVDGIYVFPWCVGLSRCGSMILVT